MNSRPTFHASAALSPAGLWLLGTTLALLLGDIFLVLLERVLTGAPWVERGRNGWLMLHFFDGLRLLVPVVVVALFIRRGALDRIELGIRLDQPQQTIRWVIIPCVLVGAAWIAFVFVVVIVIRCTGWRAPVTTLEFHNFADARDYLWHGVIMAPLIEELLHRGLLVPALVRVGGRRNAIIGAGIAFLLLHVFYAKPILYIPYYFFVGMLMAWVFLRSGNLLAPILIHALGNLTVLLWDLFVLNYPMVFRQMLGYT